MKQYAKYYAGLIALYILVAKGSNTGATISAGAKGLSTVTTTLQGRKA